MSIRILNTVLLLTAIFGNNASAQHPLLEAAKIRVAVASIFAQVSKTTPQPTPQPPAPPTPFAPMPNTNIKQIGERDFEWVLSLPETKRLADERNMPAFVYFTDDDSCIACKNFENDTLSVSSIQAKLAQNFVCAKIDIDTVSKSELSKWGVKRIPTYFLVASDWIGWQRIRESKPTTEEFEQDIDLMLEIITKDEVTKQQAIWRSLNDEIDTQWAVDFDRGVKIEQVQWAEVRGPFGIGASVGVPIFGGSHPTYGYSYAQPVYSGGSAGGGYSQSYGYANGMSYGGSAGGNGGGYSQGYYAPQPSYSGYYGGNGGWGGGYYQQPVYSNGGGYYQGGGQTMVCDPNGCYIQ